MVVLSHILVIATVLVLSEAACGDEQNLAPGDEITIEHVYNGRSKNKCINKFMCADGGSACTITVKCSEFSFSGGGPRSKPCKKNFLKVQDDKYCNETGSPDFTEILTKKLKIIAKGTKYAFSCQISVKEDILVPVTTQGSDSGNMGSDSGDIQQRPATDSSYANYTPSADTKIVGGEKVIFGHFPWQARIIIQRKSHQELCGGTVISSSWILTAKHCVDGVSASSLEIYLGDHRMRWQDEGEMERRVSQIVMGPKISKCQNVAKYEDCISWETQGYCTETVYTYMSTLYMKRNCRETCQLCTGTFLPNDIALLKLTTPAIFSAKIKPACLPSLESQSSLEGEHLWVTGWGTTAVGGDGSISDTLLKVRVPVVSNKVCRENYSPTYYIEDNELCAGTPGKGSCQGDSGGPAVWVEPQTKLAYIVGVVSWAIGCGNEGYPGVYARVTSYLEWIIETIDIKEDIDECTTAVGKSCSTHWKRSKTHQVNVDSVKLLVPGDGLKLEITLDAPATSITSTAEDIISEELSPKVWQIYDTSRTGDKTSVKIEHNLKADKQFNIVKIRWINNTGYKLVVCNAI